VVSLVVGVGGIPAEPGAAAALLLGLVVLVELLVLGLLLVVPCAEVSLWGVVLVPVAEELVLPAVELGGVVPAEVISGELDGEVADALPGLPEVEQFEEIMLALSTLKVLPLGVPITERVWPT